MNGGLSKIRSVHKYVLKGFILVVSTVIHHPKTKNAMSNSISIGPPKMEQKLTKKIELLIK